MSKSLLLKSHVDEGLPGPEHFEIVENPIPELGESGVLVQLLVLSPDPFLRGRIKPGMGTPLGKPLVGFVAGKILDSRTPQWEKGDLFGASLPFTTIQVITETEMKQTIMWKLTGIIDESQISLGIGILGMPGSTAYGGLIDVLRPQKGETIFVSAASGAVGGLVGQLAKKVFECKVIGSAGGEDKCNLLKEKLGYDFAIDYKKVKDATELIKEIKNADPSGIDMYFENVGGMHLDASLATMKRGGRIALCGFISSYNDAGPLFAQLDVRSLIYNAIRLEGFLATPWLAGQKGNFLKEMTGWWKAGLLQVQETFFDGIEQWPLAFRSLFTGANTGKVVVRV